nr:hypothetical protein [Tanacetum cinerariifolium]
SKFDARHQNGCANVSWLIARWMKRKGAGTQKESQICCGQFILKISRKSMVLIDDVIRSLSAPIYCIDLDTTTLRDLIDSRDMYHGMFEHMAGVYSVPLQGAFNPTGYAQSQYDQYYQQYPPQPPQQQQQQNDDE